MATSAAADDISIERIVVARGLVLEPKGSRLVGRCPLHEARAKLTIDSKANTWSCSACGVTDGSVVSWIQKAEGVSKKHALELLKSGKVVLDREQVGPVKGAVPMATTVRTLNLPFTAADSDGVILGGVVAFYRQALCTSSEAQASLDARGLRHPGVADHFKLGLANKTLGLHVPKTNRIAGRELRARLQGLGVLRRDTGHEQLNGCLVVPLFDVAGNIVNLYGRRLDRAQRGSADHVWADGSRNGLVNPGALRASDVIVTASITDALSCWCHGAQSVTAIHGLDGPVDLLLDGLKKSGNVERVFLTFRRTKRADRFAAALADRISSIKIAVHQALLPHNLDVSEFVTQVEHPDHALVQLIRTAPWLAGSAPAPETKLLVNKTTAAPVNETAATTTDELVQVFEDRRWRVRGLSDNKSPGTMRVNLLLSRQDVGFHVDTFDIYSARHRVAFIRQASTDLGLDEALIRRDMGSLLLQLELAQAEVLQRLQAPKAIRAEMTADEREAALRLLRDPRLLDRALDMFGKNGVVGEHDNLLLGLLAVTSRKLRRPLGVVIQSSSAAGKSSLMEAILSVVPEEDRVSYSAMTGQSLFYAPGSDLKNKVLSIAEEEGAARASYSLKLLQSEGSLTIASTGKEPGSGRLVSHEYRVQGPVALMLTTTSIDVDEELLNRCIVLTVDESPAQTKRIHERQRQLQTLDGFTGAGDHDALARLHRNAQRLLRPIRVINPHVNVIAYEDLRVRARRDHAKLLTLIEAVALLHQHQRPVKKLERDGQLVEYVEVDRSDVEFAQQLLTKLGALGIRDVPPQTLRVLGLIQEHVGKQASGDEHVRFTRRQLREDLGLGDTQLWTHLRRLLELEYVIAHRVAGRGLAYELAVVAAPQFVPDDSAETRAGFGANSGHLRPAFGPKKSPKAARIPTDLDGDRGPHRKRSKGLSRANGVARTPGSSR